MHPDAVPPADQTAAVTPRVRRPVQTAHERRQRRRRWLGYALFAASFTLMVNALVGESGYLASIRARRDYNALMASLVEVRLENQRLREEAQRLRYDPHALEAVARRELGLTHPGEVLVIVKDSAATPSR